jgi:hypothetical protein
MGQGWSCFGSGERKSKPTPENGDLQTNPDKKAGHTTRKFLLDEFDANAQPNKDVQPGVQIAPTFDIDEYELPAYSLKPESTPEHQRAIRWNALPESVKRQLILWRNAHKLRNFGHNGAFEAYISRNEHIWLDSAHTLSPITRTAILLYAAMPLLIGKAKKCNMTFFFTTYPNIKSPELDDKERRTLIALMEVFNCSTFREARNLINVRSSHLEGEGMEEFVDNRKNFEEDDEAEQKLVKLLRYTRQQMQKYWYGWEVQDLTFAILKQLYKIAIQESEKQPKLLNNTAFVYRREIGNYKRLQKKKDGESYEITCTFLLATKLTPAEVKDIQKYQSAGAKLIREAKDAKEKSGKKITLLKKGVREDEPSGETDVAQELEKQGHPFCIGGIVYKDFLGRQAQDGFTAVDTFLDGTPEDINDVTFVSEEGFIGSLLHEYWIFKTTSPHDPRVDNWPELQNTPQYNREPLSAKGETVLVPSVALVLEFVFDIAPEAPETGPSDLDILEQLQRAAASNKNIEGIPDVPTFEPASVNAEVGDQKVSLEKDPGAGVKKGSVENAPSASDDDLLDGF